MKIVMVCMIWLTLLGAFSPAFSAVVGNPQVALSTNKTSYVPGDLFVLSAALQSGTQNNVLDGYVQVQIPGGQVFYLLGDLVNFSLTPTPVVRSFPVPDLSNSFPVTMQVLPSFLPPGTYTFSAFGVTPGSSPLDPANLRSNVASISVSLTTSGAGGVQELLPLAYYHVSDSDGTTPAPGVDVVLVFEPNGIADLYVAQENDAIARRGSYSYAGGQLSLKFTADDFHPDVTFSLDTSLDTVTMPFKAFSTTPGTSTWARKRFPVVHNLVTIFRAATIGEALPRDQALARVMAYATALIQGSSRPLVAEGQATEPMLTGVFPLENGVTLQYDFGTPQDVQLFGWSKTSGASLQPSVLAADPRINLDVKPVDGRDDPANKTALLIAPFDSAKGVAWYDFHLVDDHAASSGGVIEIFGFKDVDQLDQMASLLQGRGYAVQQLLDQNVTVANLIKALIPTPGFIMFSTHGGSDGALVTGVRLGDVEDAACEQQFALEVNFIEASGYGDLLTFGGGTRDSPTTLRIAWIEREMRAKTYGCFVEVTPTFWEWLRTKGASFDRTLMDIAACLTDSTPDLRDAIKARAYLAFNVSVEGELAAAVFHYLVRSLGCEPTAGGSPGCGVRRHTHSAEETYFNILRVAGTRLMIYPADVVFNKLIPDAAAQFNIMRDVFRGYSFDGSTITSYQSAGWLNTPTADPGHIWWLLFGGRWGQDAQGGADTLLRCWNDFWSKGDLAGLGDVACHNRDPGRVPTAEEVAYASYLLTSSPVISANIHQVPRWTLNDGSFP